MDIPAGGQASVRRGLRFRGIDTLLEQVLCHLRIDNPVAGAIVAEAVGDADAGGES